MTAKANVDPIPRAVLARHESGADGTFGNIYFKDQRWSTLEPPWLDNAVSVSCIPSGTPPWLDNAVSVSCIPSGTYLCKTVKSPKFGDVYEVTRVPGRSHILFHAGNWAGDRSKDKDSDSYGCILLGSRQCLISGQLGIADSRKSVDEFWDYMFERQIYLTIVNLFV